MSRQTWLAVLIGSLIGVVTSFSALAAGPEHPRGRPEVRPDARAHEQRAAKPERAAGRDRTAARSEARGPERRATAAREGRAAERSPREAREKTRQPQEVRSKRADRVQTARRSITAAEANRRFIEKGNRPPYKEGSRARDIVLKKGREFARAYTEGRSNSRGDWLFRPHEIKNLTPKQIQEKFALPHEPTHLVSVSVPKNTVIRYGIAGPLEGWGKGGGRQYQLMNRIPEKYFSKGERIAPKKDK